MLAGYTHHGILLACEIATNSGYSQLIDENLTKRVSGFLPSPLGEVVDYLPSWVELSVTLGIFALGVTVISWLIRAALIIEEQYHR